MRKSFGPCGGDGDGTFQPPLTLSGLPSALGQSPIPVLGDFNGDGKLDILFGGNLVLLGTGSGPLSYSLLSTTNAETQNVATGLTSDGKLGLVGIPVSNLLSTSLNIVLQSPPTADFAVSGSPSYQTVVTGSSATYNITVTAIDGFGGIVTPSISGLPSGVTASFSPMTITGSGATVLTVSSSSSTPTGSYPLTLSLTSGALSHGGIVTLNVGPAGTDFTGSSTPTYENVTPDSTAGYGITITPLNGFTGTVSFSVSGLPSGATFSFSPTTVAGGSGSTNLSVVPAANTPTGSYPFTLTATSGTHVHSSGLVLNVGPSGSNFGDFTGSLTPSSQTVKAGTSAVLTLSLQPLYGYSGSVDLIPVLPSGVGLSVTGNQFPVPPVTEPITINTSSSTSAGSYTITIRAIGANSLGTVQHSATIVVNVTP